MYKLISITLLFALFVGLIAPSMPAHADPVVTPVVGEFPVTPDGFHAIAQPVINQVPQPVAVDDQLIVTGQTAANMLYLPLVSRACLFVSPLAPVAANASQQCVQLSDYAGTQGPGSLVVAVRNGAPSLLSNNLPHVAASVAITGVHIGPQSATGSTSLITHINTMSMVTDDG
jgi:hypothetical protein